MSLKWVCTESCPPSYSFIFLQDFILSHTLIATLRVLKKNCGKSYLSVGITPGTVNDEVQCHIGGTHVFCFFFFFFPIHLLEKIIKRFGNSFFFFQLSITSLILRNQIPYNCNLIIKSEAGIIQSTSQIPNQE